MMEDQHGRARSFNQEGDDEETIREAIGTCPVSCIHFVPWDELVSLERSRSETVLGRRLPLNIGRGKTSWRASNFLAGDVI